MLRIGVSMSCERVIIKKAKRHAGMNGDAHQVRMSAEISAEIKSSVGRICIEVMHTTRVISQAIDTSAW